MTTASTLKIKVMLERILEEYSLGARNSPNVTVPKYDLTYDQKIEDRNIEKILEHLKERGLFLEWLDGDGVLVIFLQNDFGENATKYLKLLGAEDGDETYQSDETKLELIVEDANLYVVHRKGRVKIGRTDTRQSKLLKFMTKEGHLGQFFSVESIADAIKKSSDSWDVYTDKRAIIEATLKEIQSKLSRSPIKLTFDDSRSNSIALIHRKSG